VAGRREDRMLRFARYNERQDASLRSAWHFVIPSMTFRYNQHDNGVLLFLWSSWTKWSFLFMWLREEKAGCFALLDITKDKMLRYTQHDISL
jgi:hypothetical protein